MNRQLKMPMNLVALKKPAGYGQHPAPKIHGRSGQPQLMPAGLNYLESIMTFTPRNEHFLLGERYHGRYKRWGNKTLISGWSMAMSRDIISKKSLNERHFLSNLDGHFFGGLTVTSKWVIFSDPHRTPSGAECFRCRGPAGPSSELEGAGWHGGSWRIWPGNPPPGPDV